MASGVKCGAVGALDQFTTAFPGIDFVGLVREQTPDQLDADNLRGEHLIFQRGDALLGCFVRHSFSPAGLAPSGMPKAGRGVESFPAGGVA